MIRDVQFCKGDRFVTLESMAPFLSEGLFHLFRETKAISCKHHNWTNYTFQNSLKDNDENLPTIHHELQTIQPSHTSFTQGKNALKNILVLQKDVAVAKVHGED